MRLPLLSLLILITYNYSSSQDKFSVDLILGPDYSFRNLRTDSESQSVVLALNTRKEEKAEIKYRVGANLNVRLFVNTWLKTGLRYVNSGYIISDRNDIKWQSEFDVNGDCVLNPELPHELKLTKSHHFIEVPIMVRQELGTGRLTPFIELGFSPMIYLITRDRTSTEFETTTSARDNTEIGYRRFYYSINFAFGGQYNVSSTSKFFVQPTFRYQAMKLQDVEILEFPYSIGIEFGLRRRLGRIK